MKTATTLLLGTAAAAAAAATQQQPLQWVALTMQDGDAARVQAAMASGIDFRGAFSNQLGLFVESDLPSLAHKLQVDSTRLSVVGAYSPEQPLWVGEHEGALNERLTSHAKWTEQVSAHAIASGMQLLDLTGVEGSLLVTSASTPEEEEWAQTTWVPVPPAAYKPARDMMEEPLVKAMLAEDRYKVVARDNKLSFVAPDPLVTRMVDMVNVDNMRRDLDELTNSFFTRQASSTGPDSVQGAEQWIEDRYAALNITTTKFAFDDNYSNNVIAELPGRDPSKFVLVGAHYDSRSTDRTSVTQRAPGADDNGTGTVAVLEMARIARELGLEFDYSIRFLHFSAEELGLVGSRAYAADLATQDDVDIFCMMNGDMLGWRLPGTRPTLGMKDRFVTEWLLETVNELSELYVPGIVVSTSGSCCSDHQAFFENGFPAVGYFENEGGASDYPDYHKSTDVVANIDFEQQELFTKAWISALGTFAVPLD